MKKALLLFISLLTISLFIAVAVLYYKDKRLGQVVEESPIDAIPAELQLKVAPDKILDSKDEVINTCTEYSTKGSSTCLNYTTETITKYSYVSADEVQLEKYNSFDEVATKRQPNAQFFESDNQGIAKVYIDDRFGGEDNRYLIEEATTTKAVFDQQVAPTILNRLNDIFFSSALADTNSTSTNNKDVALSNYYPNNNNNGVSNNISSTKYLGSPENYRIITYFTLPSGSATISDVKLYMYTHSVNNVVSYNVDVHELTQSAWAEATATWNKYDGTNSWSTAGGDYSATVVDTIARPTGVGWWNWGLYGSTADNPISGITWGSTVNLILRASTEGLDTTDADINSFAAKEYTIDTAKRPYIEITYSFATSSPSAVVPPQNIFLFE